MYEREDFNLFRVELHCSIYHLAVDMLILWVRSHVVSSTTTCLEFDYVGIDILTI